MNWWQRKTEGAFLVSLKLHATLIESLFVVFFARCSCGLCSFLFLCMLNLYS